MAPALPWSEEEVAMTALTATTRRWFWDRRGVVEVIVLLGLVMLPAAVLFLDR
jgi:hypothetical protein